MERLESKQLLSADGLPELIDLGAVDNPGGEAVQMMTSLPNGHHDASSACSFTGRVGPVENDGVFQVKNHREEWALFHYDETTRAVDASGRDVSLAGLEGVNVHVSYHHAAALRVADTIQVCRVQVSPKSLRSSLVDDVPHMPIDSTIDAIHESSSYVGRITQVENDGEVRVKNGKGEWESFTYNDNTEVVDASGADVPLDELEGVKVRVTYHTEGTKQVADKIEVCRYQVTAAELRAHFGHGDDTPFGLRNTNTHTRAVEIADQLFARGGRWYL